MKNRGFTIVELLVVIVVIGILAAITIVSYTGISQKANIASLTSDLDNASKQLKMYNVDHGAYPTSLSSNCPVGPIDTRYCIKPSGTNTYGYKAYSPNSFMIVSKNGNTCYSITNNSAPIENCITIGTQTWMKYNLDVGDRIAGANAQTNNTIVEKYCYNNDPANCTTYGGLYQWNEAMQYGGAQDICPTGFHIPTDAEYKTLEMYLGMSQAQADADGWRGTTEGTQLKPGGTSGFNMPPAGYRHTDGSFYALSDALFWSSSESDAYAWGRHLTPVLATVERYMDYESTGYSVRCLRN